MWPPPECNPAKKVTAATAEKLSSEPLETPRPAAAGLPIGVQVVGRHWKEDVVLAVMAALENHFAGRTDYPGNVRLLETGLKP